MNIDGIIENLPSTETPLNKATFQKLVNAILDAEHPIGDVHLFYDNEDHSNWLGFTWERTSIGKTPIGINSNDTDFNTIGKTGGNKTHYHVMPLGFDGNGYIYGKGDNDNNPYYGSVTEMVSKRMFFNPINYQNDAPVRIAFTSNGNSLQPYEVFAFWKRIA